MPVLTPAELWEATGRIAIPEVFQLKDRTGRPFVLPLTHEETVTFHAREIQSYRELPQLWYHFQTKDRDEPRPRGGLLRVREFIMKDALLVRPRRGRACALSFEREPRGVPADLRPLRPRDVRRPGRERDHGRQVQHRLPGAGRLGREHARPLRERRLRAPTSRRAGRPARAVFPQPLDAPEEVETPGVTTIEALAEFLGIDAAATSKAMPVVKSDDGTLVLALVRGDDRLSETKLYDALPAAFRPATDDEIRPRSARAAARSAPSASTVEVIADETLREGPVRRRREPRRLAPARRRGRRDYEPRFADLASRSRATVPEVRRRADLPDRRSRSATSSTSGASTRSRWARRSSTRTAREAAPQRQLRHRPRAGDGRDRRAAPRRARDPLAAVRGAVRCPRRRAARARGERRVR